MRKYLNPPLNPCRLRHRGLLHGRFREQLGDRLQSLNLPLNVGDLGLMVEAVGARLVPPSTKGAGIWAQPQIAVNVCRQGVRPLNRPAAPFLLVSQRSAGRSGA
jgi:hypothetical protein